MRLKSIVFAIFSAVLLVGDAPAVEPNLPPLAHEDAASHDARMAWWREARFGMFIHWGLYAIPAGEWNDVPVNGAGEWIQFVNNIPTADYEPLARKFRPTAYDPAEWARIAKQAGMKYVVITAKHHDGFCLFDSKVTDWDVIDATPHGADLLVPLAEECRKQGLKFCVYYSIMDWHHPSQERGAGHWGHMKPGRKQEYIDYMQTQLKELVESCDPELIWFDGEWMDWWTEADGRRLYAYLHDLKPSLVINNRVGKGRNGMQGFNRDDQQYVGDYFTPEQEIPATGAGDADWESCMTMNNETWGFHKHRTEWKSAETLIHNVVDTASKGGNYLLNIGPMASGEVPPESVERLIAVGRWTAVNGEAIYGTTTSPFANLTWGRCTVKACTDGTTKLYLHVFDWPEGGVLRVPGLLNDVVSAEVLSDGAPVTVARAGEDVVLSALPLTPPDKVNTVVTLTVHGLIRVSP